MKQPPQDAEQCSPAVDCCSQILVIIMHHHHPAPPIIISMHRSTITWHQPAPPSSINQHHPAASTSSSIASPSCIITEHHASASPSITTAHLITTMPPPPPQAEAAKVGHLKVEQQTHAARLRELAENARKVASAQAPGYAADITMVGRTAALAAGAAEEAGVAGVAYEASMAGGLMAGLLLASRQNESKAEVGSSWGRGSRGRTTDEAAVVLPADPGADTGAVAWLVLQWLARQLGKQGQGPVVR